MIPEHFTPKTALSPTVIRLGWISFFADLSSEMLYPITPIFLTSVLGTPIVLVGLIEGIAEATASLLKTYSGRWSDQLSRRKPFMVFGYFLAAITKPMIGLAHSWTQVLAARGLDRTGKGLRSAPRDALLADAIPKSQRGQAFGWHRGMDTMGATLGPLIAIIFLYIHPHHLRPLYYLAVIPGLISVAIAMSVVEPPPSESKSTEKWTFQWAEFSKPFKQYLVSWGIFSLVNSSDVFLLLCAKHMGLSVIKVILVYCFYNLLYATLSPYFGSLSDQLGRKWVLTSGLFLFSMVYFGFSTVTQPWQLILLFGGYGIYMAITDGVGKAWCVDLIPSHLKATGLGILGTVTGVATLIASAGAGLIWDHFGPHWVFVVGATGALIAAVSLMIIRPETNTSPQS